MELAGQLDADGLGPADVPGEAGHDVDGVGTANADRDHAEPAGVRGVAVGAEHHAAREGVVLEHDLVDDARPGCPEAAAVLGADGLEEVVHLAVGVGGDLKVGLAVDPRLDEVIAVGRRRHRCPVEAGGHELQPGHLRGGVLHRDAIGTQVGVGDPTLHTAVLDIVEMVDQDLLGERERSPETGSADRKAFIEPCVDVVDKLDWGSRKNGHFVLLFGEPR